MSILASARLRFEPLDERHLDGLQAMNRDPEVQRYLSGHAETRDETLAMIGRVRARWAAWGYGWWAFIDLSTGEVVGAGGIQHLDNDPAQPLELGWRLRVASWGMGLASEAAQVLVRHAFEVLDAPLVCAVRHPDNLGSRRVMEKLGMREVGVRDMHGEMLTLHELTRGEWLDHRRPREGGDPC